MRREVKSLENDCNKCYMCCTRDIFLPHRNLGCPVLPKGSQCHDNSYCLTSCLCLCSFSAITNALHLCEGMSSERWEESTSRARPEETGLEKQQGEIEEKEEVKVPHQDCQLVGRLTLEEELPKRCLSPDHNDRQEVTSKGRVEWARREKTQKERKFSRFKNSQRRKKSGVWRESQVLIRMPANVQNTFQSH